MKKNTPKQHLSKFRIMKKRVLICDDDQSILEISRIILEEQGYEVIIDQGKNTFETIKSTLPHLILLDIRLGAVSGVEIAKRIRNDPETRKIPIVILSASFTIEEDSEKAHADAYVKKPFNVDDLENIVKKYLQI